jgi:HEAT repeat protein
MRSLLWCLLLVLCACPGRPNERAANTAPLPPEARAAQFWSEARAIVEGDDPQGAFLVMEAIEDLGGAPDTSLLLRGLSDDDGVVRARAARSYTLTQRQDLEVLRPLLNDADIEARLWAAGGLAKAGDAAARALLEGFVRDPKPFLDASAAAGEEPGGRSFREKSYLLAAGEAMNAAGLPGTPALETALASEYPQVKYPAALALLRSGDARQQSTAREGFSKGFLSARLAVYVFEASQDPRDLEAPAQAYAAALSKKDQAQQVIASWALAKAGVDEVRAGLEEAERSPSVELRFLARWALLSPKSKGAPAAVSKEMLHTPPPSAPGHDPHAHHH